jgi:hypothetical protein
MPVSQEMSTRVEASAVTEAVAGVHRGNDRGVVAVSV